MYLNLQTGLDGLSLEETEIGMTAEPRLTGCLCRFVMRPAPLSMRTGWQSEKMSQTMSKPLPTFRMIWPGLPDVFEVRGEVYMTRSDFAA